MFETAELGQVVSGQEYRRREPVLRGQLLDVQARLRASQFATIVLFAGVDGAGKGATTNLLCEWMDPRGIVTRAYGEPSSDDREKPHFWRYWRDLPPTGQLGIFLSAWYSKPLVSHVYGETTTAQFDESLDEVIEFERTLSHDGALVVKFWMHLGKSDQKRRFRTLEKDPAESWRVTELDWKHWRKYEKFISSAEGIMMRTSTGLCPWHIIDGRDSRYRTLRVGTLLHQAIERRLEQDRTFALGGAVDDDGPVEPSAQTVDDSGGADDAHTGPMQMRTILQTLDMGRTLAKGAYNKQVRSGQARLNRLHRLARQRKRSTILVFEGWDAGGKGGAIRRVATALDARAYEVISIAAPTDEEQLHHYLWRFWRHIPRSGRVTFFDRSWYGRVLVERVEGFATELEWRRAYMEINAFEQQLVRHGIVLIKFWLHITQDEQERRFLAREEVPYKRWKLTDEDWRNRARWGDYEHAVHDMIERTSTSIAPWILVEGNDKRYARIKVLNTIGDHLEKALEVEPEVDPTTRDT